MTLPVAEIVGVNFVAVPEMVGARMTPAAVASTLGVYSVAVPEMSEVVMVTVVDGGGV